MNSNFRTYALRAIARGVQIAVLAGSLVVGAVIGGPAAHAAPATTPPIIVYGPCGASAKHDVLTAYGFTRAIDATVYVSGTCFPFFSTARITITDLTSGNVLAHSIAEHVSVLGGFQYQTPGARANDKVRVHVSDGKWHKTVTFTVGVSIP